MKHRDVILTLEIRKVENTERDYYVRVKEWGANCPIADTTTAAIEKAVTAIREQKFTNQDELIAKLDALADELEARAAIPQRPPDNGIAESANE